VNTRKQFGKDDFNTSMYYELLNKTHGKASDCIECGQCEEHCPQHLPIIDDLKMVKEMFEKD
jgi:predicted aldo/keto reductase-like oxidoreductase